ncbi:MAG: hypothetical protein HQL51_15060 [Magnetococcales bacterium]|nr:hypothetical protein [Magnetococcales bacterium]
MRRISPRAMFLLTALTLLPFAVTGLDISDEGFFLVNQSRILSLGVGRLLDNQLWWLSDLAGGLWLRLVEPWGLAGARLGGVVLVAGTAALAGAALRRLEPDRALSALSGVWILVAALAQQGHGILLIHYYTFPAFLLLLFVGLLLRAAVPPIPPSIAPTMAPPVAAFSASVAPLLAGGVLWLLTLARLPAVTALLIPGLLAFLAPRLLPPMAAPPFRRAMLRTLGGFGVAAGLWLLAMALFSRPALQGYLDQLFQTRGHPASGVRMGGIVGHALQQLWANLPLAVVLAVIPVLAAKGAERLGRPWAALPLVLIPAAPLLALEWRQGVPLLMAAWILLAAWMMRHWRDRRFRHPLTLTALACAFFLPWAAGFPSGNVLGKLFHGGWLAPALAALLWGLRPCRRFAAWGAALAALPVALGVVWTEPYRDHPDRFQRLTQSPDVERLAGVRTTPERAAALTEVVREIQRRSPEQAPVLIYGNAPLLYYASRRVPALDRPWLMLHHETRLGALTQPLCRPGGIWPTLIVRTLTNPRNRYWGSIPPEAAVAGGEAHRGLDRQARANLSVLDAAVARCDPQTVWSNREFMIMIPQPGGERWRPLGEAIAQVKARAAGRKILAYGVPPLLSMEAEAPPLLGTHWIPWMQQGWVERLLEPVCREGGPRPALIVRPRREEGAWARAEALARHTSPPLAPGDDALHRPAMERAEARCGLASVWSNELYEILAPPDNPS